MKSLQLTEYVVIKFMRSLKLMQFMKMKFKIFMNV